MNGHIASDFLAGSKNICTTSNTSGCACANTTPTVMSVTAEEWEGPSLALPTLRSLDTFLGRAKS